MGIQFNILDEESTKLYLKNDNYYFKIMMFKDNYVKSNNGKYRDLEFTYLKELSIIDMHLRYLLI